ncbi:MAG: cation-translocating P-type ATPase [Legionella sp.]|nr:cation-translocating P-type ATPase [Legionella sp.]
MIQQIIFEAFFPVSGIMCHKDCGKTIRNALTIDDITKKTPLPLDARLRIDAEPQSLGIHKLIILIESEKPYSLTKADKDAITSYLREQLEGVGYPVVSLTEDKMPSNSINWYNIAVNLVTVLIIISLSLTFPPSMLLTISLSTLSCFASTFSARSYISQSLNSLRHKNVSSMATSITLGWFLSLAHTLYHAFTMPLAGGISMVFMSYIMPILLIALINGMETIKSLIVKNSQAMHLKGMRSLFPHMSEVYEQYPLTAQQQQQFGELKDLNADDDLVSNMTCILLNNVSSQTISKNLIKEGLLIKIRPGECFPVDGFIVQGHTVVDSSLYDGELHQSKHPLQTVPAGATNLGEEVLFYTETDSYSSSLNQLLFRANRGHTTKPGQTHQKFHKIYTILIFLSLLIAFITPLALGVLTLPMLLQNLTGILFTVCPCTIAIAHQLPLLLNTYHLARKGVVLRAETINNHSEKLHTVVFDKTGTLTTGQGKVVLSEGIEDSTMQRVYLLENQQGGAHPLAKAITSFYESQKIQDPVIADIGQVKHSKKKRGLSAYVQGKEIHIGSLKFLTKEQKIEVPELSQAIQQGLDLGYTAVYVAEGKVFQGVLLIQQESRTNILQSLEQLIKDKIKIILLTGDTKLSAEKFNQQHKMIFNPNNIKAEQQPSDKEDFLQTLINESPNPGGICVVCDGLNDALFARLASDKGGMSCSITALDKAAYFTDVSLNDGSLEYIFKYRQVNLFLKKIIQQNQGIITFSTVAFLAFIITCSIVGIGVLPIIPLSIMLFTTLCTLFNTYRIKLSVDIALDKRTSWLKRCFASDVSLGLLMGGSSLLMVSLLLSTVIIGGLAFPAMVFTAGLVTTVSSSCAIMANILLGLFIVLSTAFVVNERCIDIEQEIETKSEPPFPQSPALNQSPLIKPVKFESMLSKKLPLQVAETKQSNFEDGPSIQTNEDEGCRQFTVMGLN